MVDQTVVLIETDGLHVEVQDGRAVMVAEASQLGFPPGFWPMCVRLTGSRPSSYMTMTRDQVGEHSTLYKNIQGDRLEVLND